MESAVSIKWVDTIDSTNNELQRNLKSYSNMDVLAAVYQTAGKGQRGNVWKSAAGDNMTFSMLLKLPLSCSDGILARDQFIISMAATLAVSDFVRSKGANAMVKWPNDIYVGNRKICGILVENTLVDRFVAASIIGIGVNLNQTEFAPEILNPTSIKLLRGKDSDLKQSTEEICAMLAAQISRIWTDPEGLRTDYLDRLYRKDEVHEYRDNLVGQVFRGTIKGISDAALLQVEMPDGSIKEFGFKEISYII